MIAVAVVFKFDAIYPRRIDVFFSCRRRPFLDTSQGAGKRRWSIEETATSGDEETGRTIDDIDVRVLSDFREAQVRLVAKCSVSVTCALY